MANQAKIKVRQYSIDYLKFGFIAAPHDPRLPYCLLCNTTLCNDSMKPAKLLSHLQLKHKDKANRTLDYFVQLKHKFSSAKTPTLPTLFKAADASKDRALTASYEMSLLIARNGKSHTIGEEIIKPALNIFNKVMQHKNDSDVALIPLSNDSVRSRIDEMAGDIERQLSEKLRVRKFTIQLDETTVLGSQTLLMAYVRYMENENFQEEMLFCQNLELTTTALDIYNSVVDYFAAWQIPMTNVISCAADGAPAMMGKHGGCLKLMQENNPRMKVVHCVIHRENLVAKNLAPELHNVMMTVIKCINYIKSNPKTERIFTRFYRDMEGLEMKLLLHTQVRWLSKGKCLDRFVEMYDVLCNFFDTELFSDLWQTDSKALVHYLADIYGKLNVLNLSLQGANKTLVDAKSSIFGFVTRLRLLRSEVGRREFRAFQRLSECSVSDTVLVTICNHLHQLAEDFESRFSDLKLMVFPDWVTQPFMCNLESLESADYQQELSELIHDPSAAVIHKTKGQMMWFSTEICTKFPILSRDAQLMLLPFPTSYLVECGFSAVMDILTKKRNRLHICKRGDLRIKLSKLVPDVSALAKKHQAQGSH